MAMRPYTGREVDAFRERGDAFIRDMVQEYYDHFAGLKETLDIERIYEEYEDLTQIETAQRLKGAPTELWRFACEGFLGNLTRVAPGEGRGGRGDARGDGRRRDDPVPDAARRDVERARPRQAAPARRGADPPARRAPEPASTSTRPRSTATPCATSTRRTTTSSTSGSASGSTSSPTNAARCSTRPRSSGSAKGDKLFRARLGLRARRGAAVGRRPPLPRAGARRAVPGGPDAARARRRRSPSSASTSARSRTCISTSRRGRASRRARSARRSRCPAR